MHPDQRQYFDRHLEAVLQDLPKQVHNLLEEVPLIVDDYPPISLCRRLGLRHQDELCGLYTGVALTERSVDMSGIPSDVIQLFRAGIWRLAEERGDGPFDGELQKQIRLTILHEVGHHFGLSEQDLEELGYG